MLVGKSRSLSVHGLILLVCCAGTQVPAGEDWRSFCFTHLRRALILLPILSKSFLFSRACEDELTFAYDLSIIPVVCDDEYTDVLSNPEAYTETSEDIEIIAAKLASILHSRTRVLPSAVMSLRL